ncbi:MAG TPA: PBP1A family penicillin-binding protein, partial [Methyloceanibacter sp.]|nr:PBP1A family penicillin-binding protein [Methyloceanibacter sp.]
ARRGVRPGAKVHPRGEPSFGGRRGSLRPPRRKRKASRLKRALSRHPLLYRSIRLALLTLIWGGIILGGATVYFILQVPDPIIATLDDRPPNLTILAADGTVLAERGLRRGHVRLDKLPPYLAKAVMATEDRRFYRHFGVDPIGLVRATFRNAQAGAVVEGGSTITQQLAKNLFLRPDRTVTRKLEEVVYAVWLEQRFSKDEILELYLNRVYFGGGTYGVEAAARHYFGKSARFVSLSQAALLAGLLKAPSRYAPSRSVRRASARVDEVLDNMVEAGFLTEAEAKAAAQAPLRLRAIGDETGFPYAVDWVAELLPEYVGENEGDLIVDTTIDPALQRAAQKALRGELDREGRTLKVGEGAVLVLDPMGGVKALVGGRSYRASPFDRAIKALRQPGSAFKPFVYLAAMESGYTPDSVATDAPVSVAGWSPKNYTGIYQGEVTLRQSMAQSLNTVAVKLAEDVGMWRVIRTARRLGIHAKLHDRPSLALGTAEVTLLELTGAYVPFANGGQGVLPHIIVRVRNGDGKTLYARKTSTTGQVVALPYVAAMNDMLNATIIRGTGKAAALPDHVAAGKTGTSQNSRDAWFVGYTAHYVAGIWVGNDDGAPMRKVTGGTVPAKLWHDIMLYAHQDKLKLPLPGTTAPRFQEAVARLPFTASAPAPRKSNDDQPFLSRILGVLSGG